MARKAKITYEGIFSVVGALQAASRRDIADHLRVSKSPRLINMIEMLVSEEYIERQTDMSQAVYRYIYTVGARHMPTLWDDTGMWEERAER